MRFILLHETGVDTHPVFNACLSNSTCFYFYKSCARQNNLRSWCIYKNEIQLSNFLPNFLGSFSNCVFIVNILKINKWRIYRHSHWLVYSIDNAILFYEIVFYYTNIIQPEQSATVLQWAVSWQCMMRWSSNSNNSLICWQSYNKSCHFLPVPEF